MRHQTVNASILRKNNGRRFRSVWTGLASAGAPIMLISDRTQLEIQTDDQQQRLPRLKITKRFVGDPDVAVVRVLNPLVHPGVRC